VIRKWLLSSLKLCAGATRTKSGDNDLAARLGRVYSADVVSSPADIGQLEDGFLRITDRKKDLIVTAGGKKVAPQPLENAIKARTVLVAQAVVYGDKRPYCVALLTPSEDALKRFGGKDGALADVSGMRAEVAKVIEGLNAGLAPYETIKAFAILPADFTEAAGELTPSLKVKRKVVADKYRSAIEDLYKNARVAAEA